MSKLSGKPAFAALAVFAAFLAQPAGAGDEAEMKGVALNLGKVEEAEAKSSIGDPNFGYVGQLGAFEATKEGEAAALIVLHAHPDTSKSALGRTKLTFEGAKRLSDVDGWVFKTRWDGKKYPSKVFFSAEKVYFGGGVNAYIAADYREGTGWTWKLHPMRRMELVKQGAAE